MQLSGFVSSRGDIYRATEIARAVQGVTSLANDMRLALVTAGSALVSAACALMCAR